MTGSAPTDKFASPDNYTPKHLAEKILTSKGALEGERKQVTVLFCDIANSTATAERLGAERMHTLLSRFFEMALVEIHRYEGTVNQFLGDGIMALFGAPLAHEDHARRAVLAALAIQRALREPAAALPEAVELAVRIGLNTGFVVVGAIGDNLRMDYTAIGDTTHLAARLQQMARPGTILIGETTARLVTGYVRLEALEPVQVKGWSSPVDAYRVEGLGRRRSPLDGIEERRLSPFVGRDREMTVLRELLSKATSSEGQVIGIVGEPGVGKSRLLLELRRGLGERSVTYLEGRCLSFGGAIPYLPIMDIVRNNCGIAETDTPETMATKLGAALEEVDLGAAATPYLLHLLGVREGTESLAGLSPEAIKASTFETLLQMTRNGSLRRPLVMAVEDAHWIDRTSQEFLEVLADSVAGTPLVLLVTFRPGYRPPWVEKSYATQLALQRLAPKDSLTVVRSVLQSEAMAASAAEPILQKAEGNPFFLEELARAVTEHGGLHAGLSVPDTVHGVLMARIDRLPEGAKHTLQTASVLGREFSSLLLGALWDGTGPFEPHLIELKRGEFLYERTVGGELVYVFKHALTQDVAYESLLTPRRRALHAAAGRALEKLYADRLEEFYERIAHHYSRAEESEKAVTYLVRSSEKAARVYANADAVTALQAALAHAGRLPAQDRERHLVEICLRVAASNYFLGQFAETVDLLDRYLARVEQLAEASLLGRFCFELAHAYSHLGQSEEANRAARRAVEEAGRCGDDLTMGKALYVLTKEAMWAAEYAAGVQAGKKAVELLQKTDERWWLGQSQCWVGINLYFLGELDAALAWAQQGRATGEAIGDRRIQSYAEWNIAWFSATRGDGESAVAFGRQSLQRSPDPLNTAFATAWLGYAYAELGDAARAIEFLEQGIQRLEGMQYSRLVAWHSAWLSEAYLLAGQRGQARDAGLRALAISREVRFRWAAAVAQRALGRTALAEGSLAEARALLDEALQTFLAVEARLDAGRTHLALAQLARTRGSSEELAWHLSQTAALLGSRRPPGYVA